MWRVLTSNGERREYYQHNVWDEVADSSNRISHEVGNERGLPGLPNLTPLLELLHGRLVSPFIVRPHRDPRLLGRARHIVLGCYFREGHDRKDFLTCDRDRREKLFDLSHMQTVVIYSIEDGYVEVEFLCHQAMSLGMSGPHYYSLLLHTH